LNKYSLASNDVSDHCVVATARDTKLPKQKSRIITKRCLKYFNEQCFLQDLATYDWERISLIPDVEFAWQYFYDGLTSVLNRHAPFKKFRVKGRDNPWFSTALSVLIRERDTAWAKARQSDSDSDWIRFRQLRNKCTVAIRQAKADYFIAKTTTNLNNPKLFWQNIKYIAGNKKSSDFPSCIIMDSTIVSDKEQILNHFNKHFIDSGSLFESNNVLPSNNDFISAETIFKKEEFTFVHIKSSDVHA